MAEYLSPGVYVEEYDSGPTPMTGVSTSIAGFIGVAEKGPVVGAPVLVTGPADFARKFGGYLQASEFGEYRYLAYAVNHFFVNGGSKAFIMRVAPADAKVAEAKPVKGKNGVLDIKAVNPGVWGNSVTVEFTPSSDAKTQILEDLGEGKYRLKNAIGFDVGDIVVLEGAGKPQTNKVTGATGNNVTFAKPFDGQVVDAGLLPKVVLKTCSVDDFVTC